MARVHELGGMIRLGTEEEARAARQELAEIRVRNSIAKEGEQLTKESRERLAAELLQHSA